MNRRKFLQICTAAIAIAVVPIQLTKSWVKEHWNGTVINIRYYNRRLSNNELMELSNGTFSKDK